jgi:serine/threonine protein kinase
MSTATKPKSDPLNKTSSTGQFSATSTQRRQVENANRKITDYQLMRVIGTGTFGKVYLATLGKEVIALKALKKTQLIELKQVEHIKTEKNILSQLSHPFIVNL